MFFRKACVFGVMALAVMGAGTLLADTVLMEDGDKLTGRIEKVTADTVEMTTKHAGRVTIQRSAVKSMWSEEAVTVVGADGASRQVFLAPTKDGGWEEQAVVAAKPEVGSAALKVVEVVPLWKNRLVLGIVNTTGNTESTAFAGELGFKYAEGPTELSIRIGGEYAVTDGNPSAQRFFNDNLYKRTLPEWNVDHLFFFAESRNVYDGIARISLRSQDAVGFGYRLWKNEKLEASLRAGPGVTYERNFGGTSHTDLSCLIGLSAKYDFNERASLTQSIVYTQGLTDVDRYQISSETALQLKLPEIARGVGLRFMFRDDYDATTVRPTKHNNTRLVVGLTYEF
ncbi:MAG: DUF481 domain-containing protein [Phycisphaerales bacterium]|nr:DUF481 domain-containing protein [Phycisphaerales bacterium]